MKEIKLTKRYPQSRTEDIVDAYMRGWNDALDAVQNGKFIINDDCKTEPQTENLFTDRVGDVWEWRDNAWYCISGQDEPQTDCAWK